MILPGYPSCGFIEGLALLKYISTVTGCSFILNLDYIQMVSFDISQFLNIYIVNVPIFIIGWMILCDNTQM